jgi:hypothetical protein
MTSGGESRTIYWPADCSASTEAWSSAMRTGRATGSKPRSLRGRGHPGCTDALGQLSEYADVVDLDRILRDGFESP